MPLLFRRKGGHGGGHGGGHSSGHSSSGKSSSSHSSGGGGSEEKSSSGGSTSRGAFKVGGTSRQAEPFSAGGGKAISIPKGNPFAGRLIGGTPRTSMYGSRDYGTDYPPTYTNNPGLYRGGYTSGRGFPFGFWPIYWGGLYGGDGYYQSHEYGPENNSSRPGGGLYTASVRSSFWPNSTSLIQLPTSFAANSTTNSTTPPGALLRTLHIIGDQQSVQEIMDVLVSSSCDVFNSTILPYNASSIPLGLNSPNSSNTPRPEEVIQYYRSSSFALTMDGYNNTAALASNAPPAVLWSNTSVPTVVIVDTPLPTNGTDMTFLSCVNQTIGEALPIMSGADRVFLGVGMMPGLGLMWLFVLMFHSFL